MRRARGLLALLFAVVTLASCGSRDSQQLVSIGADLQGSSGLRASVYAQGLPNAAAMAFDDQGRLWVATAAYDDAGTDAVYLIDAVGSTPQKVIADAHTPLGLLWLDDSLYVAATGGVQAYSGFDGTAFAEHHTVVSLPDGTGEVNGLALSNDGRISLGVSAPCDSCMPTSQWSAAVLSFLPDGTDLRVDASGIRAPVGLSYFPGTNELYVTMNQRDDLGEATPGDWLSIVAPGQDWDFPGCYGQGGTACEGAPSPIAELDPHAAVSDVEIVTGELGTRIGTAAIVAEWAKGVVLAVPLTPDGSGATGAAQPLISGVKNPVALTLGPDDALLVADWATGTVYRVSPSSQPALTTP
jgi:glucose/arabinose dehydrogenase